MSIFKLRTRRTVAIGSTAGLMAGFGLAAVAFSSSAEAIPTYERSCTKLLQTNTAANGWRPVLGSVVTVHNGAFARDVVVNFNSDAGVAVNAEIRLAYRVDGGALQSPGAANFANYTQYWQTRHNMTVLRIGRGNHVIRPYWRISGAVGKTGVLHGRCLTAEAYTS